MTSKRGRPEIIFDILMSVQKSGGRIKPTRLLYKSNLSHARLKLYLESLTSQGLLSTGIAGNESRKFIMLTEKGYKFITEYQKMKELVASFGI